MAKKPTPTAPAEAAPAAPSQPWAQGSAPATPAESAPPAPATEPTPAPVAETTESSENEAAPVTLQDVRDEGLDIQADMAGLTEDERIEFEAFMVQQARDKLEQITRGRKAREMEVNLVDGAEHYGKRASQRRAKDVEA